MVRLPEMVAVVVKLRVTVETFPGNVMITVVPGSFDVTVRVKLSIFLFHFNVSNTTLV